MTWKRWWFDCGVEMTCLWLVMQDFCRHTRHSVPGRNNRPLSRSRWGNFYERVTPCLTPWASSSSSTSYCHHSHTSSIACTPGRVKIDPHSNHHHHHHHPCNHKYIPHQEWYRATVRGQGLLLSPQTWDLSKNLHDRRFQGKKFTQKTRNFWHLLNRDKKRVNALNWDKTSKKCSVTM